jgi:hypothetical protein
MAVMFYLLWNDAIAAGPFFRPSKMPVEFWITLGAVVIGLVWYLWSKRYRKQRGINIGLAFRQIPIE